MVLPRPAETGLPLPEVASTRRGDFRITDDDVRRVADRGRALLGIDLNETKRPMIYARLSRRLRALGAASFSDYLDHLDTPAGLPEAEHFANALTTNLTAFFREAHHLEHFERELSRPLCEKGRRLRIWSAGCSTGEEAWSIAMILHANAELLTGRDRRVLATDVDTEVLATASRGVYARDRLKGVPPRFRTPAFITLSPEGATMAPALQDLVVFRALNLITPWPFKGRFDVIFCRNVLIYFSAELRERTIERFSDLLQPGGVLYLGHSESILGPHPKLIAEGHTIYRRAAA